MPDYEVEVRGDVREVYIVEADSEADAMTRWHEGELFVSEASNCEPVSAKVSE